MKDFLKRAWLGLLTGWIIVYYGEFVFWATPDREGMNPSGILGTWLVYSLLSYIFLCVVSVFRVRRPAAVFLAGAFYGWLEEGIFVQTMYGSADGSFPISISFTGLAWHALIDVFFGWYLLRKVLSENHTGRVVGLACAIGLFYGIWAIWWWNEPPPAMKLLLEQGQRAALALHFTGFAFATTGVLILVHALYNRVMPFVFKPSKTELGFLGVATLLYYAFVTVPAAPKALWVLPPLLAVTFWALNKNRRVETQPDVISAFTTKVAPLHYLALLCIPTVACVIYCLALVAELRLSTNKLMYYISSPLGALLWLGSVVTLTRRSVR